jgi:hypothetical protein
MTVVYALWRLVGWRGLLVAIIIAAGAWWHLSRVSAAYDRGAQVVRIEWQEANRRAELAALERQKKQQAEINQAEAELLTTQTQAAMRRRALENALEAERASDDQTGLDRAVCRLPDGVRNALRY